VLSRQAGLLGGDCSTQFVAQFDNAFSDAFEPLDESIDQSSVTIMVPANSLVDPMWGLNGDLSSSHTLSESEGHDPIVYEEPNDLGEVFFNEFGTTTELSDVQELLTPGAITVMASSSHDIGEPVHKVRRYSSLEEPY